MAIWFLISDPRYLAFCFPTLTTQVYVAFNWKCIKTWHFSRMPASRVWAFWGGNPCTGRSNLTSFEHVEGESPYREGQNSVWWDPPPGQTRLKILPSPLRWRAVISKMKLTWNWKSTLLNEPFLCMVIMITVWLSLRRPHYLFKTDLGAQIRYFGTSRYFSVF